MKNLHSLFCLLLLFGGFCEASSQIKTSEIKNMKVFVYSNADNKTVDFDFSIEKKKAFLFFDNNTIHEAELLNNGCRFVFSGEELILFPVCFKGYLSYKELPSFESEIPIQFKTIPLASEFFGFEIKEADFPVLIIYNEKNELCGIAKNVESIAGIKCETKL